MKSAWHGCRWALYLGVILPLVPATAQDEPAGTPPYLLRMERMRLDDSVCVLVRSDGRYHLEHSDWEKTEVFEGDISKTDLDRLVHWVGENELFDLTQDKIVTPLFRGPKDELGLAVNRPGHWQNLSFPSPATWQRYSQSVVPLVQWFDEVRKAKHRLKLREEESRNNCKPPSRPRLSTRSSEMQHPVVPFVFLIQTTTFKGKEGEKRCAVVYPNGRYHRETKSQRQGSDEIATAVYEGSVKTDGMQKLKTILASPEIQNRKEAHLPWGMYQTDEEVTALIFPQEGKARTMFFWKFAPAPGVEAVGRLDESGMKAVEPLRHWLESNVDDPGVAPLANTALSDCVPPQQP